MASFDKAKPVNAAEKQKKQLIMMSLLGVAFVGVLVYQFGPMPRSASASSFSNSAGSSGEVTNNLVANAANESPAEVLARLQDDPTANLLRANASIDPTFDIPPENPFSMSRKWRSNLTRLETVTQEPIRITQTVTPQPAVKTVPTINTDDVKLQGIFRDAKQVYAIINGKMVTVGAVLGNARIVEIADDRIILQHAASLDGPRVEVFLKNKVK